MKQFTRNPVSWWATSRSASLARRLLRRTGIGVPFAMLLGGALVDEGWYRSYRLMRSVGRQGDPVPWYTYPCRAFLEERLDESLSVFEYGAGMSSLWYAARVGRVIAVEHDAAWAELIAASAPSSLTVVLEVDEDRYVDAGRQHSPVDVVVIDGICRQAAACTALEVLSPTGVLIWDNSDWPEFDEAYPTFRDLGFRKIGFRGIGPINRQQWETTILYRPGNCLGI